MRINFLKLNSDKTELVIITSKASKHRLTIPEFNIDGIVIEPSNQARNLGVIFDSNLTYKAHINKVCKKAFLNIRNISQVRRYLNTKTATTIVQACMLSHLDYCNALLVGLPKHLIQKLQRVQNPAAILITRAKCCEHITPILKGLHWLKVEQRIRFKVLVLVFKAQHGLAPSYLEDLIIQYQPTRTLRSCDQSLLEVPPSRTISYGDRCFARAGPLLWNALPKELRMLSELNSFKKHLKTHLFSKIYTAIPTVRASRALLSSQSGN
ncbi:uncharacterized protein LOC125373274 [Haliotis rufescens]|uniref:uncharacterized protein LOC125373274 n=1 Tax=Haliotis rufescens TaxID=6454 RepID=UPI00201F508C|nr:uncharacterized protein LOC125373274 [Haliotis rufescens]